MPTDPYGARRELRDRIRAKVAEVIESPGLDHAIAANVMELFADVTDDWDRIDVHAFGDGEGENWLWQRSIVATTKPVQAVPVALPVVREALREEP